MTKQERNGSYRPKKQAATENTARAAEEEYRSASPVGHHMFRKRFMFLSLLFAAIPHFYLIIDEQIDGSWGSYPPLSFLTHPEEDFFLDFPQIVKKYGGNIDEYWTTTDDGYMNLLFRINKFSPEELASPSPKPAVLVIHGHLDSTDSFFARGETSLLNQLMDAGYDVWLGNTRGNKYSERHATLDPLNDYQYWHDAYPDKSAQYDVPAFIEKAVGVSNVENLTVVAHSVATRNMIYNLVENGTYFSSRINHLILLAPFTESHSCTFVNSLFMNGNAFIDDYFPKSWKVFRSFKSSFIINIIMKWGCTYAPWSCEPFAKQMSHTTDEYNDGEAEKVLYSSFPAQSSFKNWQMIKQTVASQNFQKFDFGSDENLKMYGQATPPILDAGNAMRHATIPLFLIAAKHDILVNYEDQKRLYEQLKQAQTADSADLEYLEINGGHTAYMLGKDMSWVQDMLEKISKRNPIDRK